MSFGKNTPRVLGIAFLFQAVASLLSETVSDSLIDLDGISNSMINISNNTVTMQAGIVGRLVTAIGILLLTVLLYTTLKSQNKVVARWAFGLILTEVATFAVIVMSAFSLLFISQEFATTGVSDPSYFVTFGSLSYNAMEYASIMNILFFSLGAFLFYYLFLKSKYIPKVFSVWGMVSTFLALIGILFALFGYGLNTIMYLIAFLPILPLELAIGVWLKLRDSDFRRRVATSKRELKRESLNYGRSFTVTCRVNKREDEFLKKVFLSCEFHTMIVPFSCR
jgi:hypothetical protein